LQVPTCFGGGTDTIEIYLRWKLIFQVGCVHTMIKMISLFNFSCILHGLFYRSVLIKE